MKTRVATSRRQISCALAVASLFASTAAFAADKRPADAAQPAAGAQPDAFTSAIPTDKPVHLLIGRSMFVDTKARLTRVYVTNPTVLSAHTVSPTEVLVTTKAAGISSLVVWDESGTSQSYLISSDLDIDTLRSSIKQAL